MAAPSYETDLTTITTADAAAQFAEVGTWVALGTQAAPDAENFFQGTAATTFAWKTGLGGAVCNNGSGITLPTDGAFFVWQYHAAPSALDTEANGGVRLIVGSALGDFNAWKLAGSDSYAYGGWQCLAVNPTLTPDYTVGSPSGTLQYVGWGGNQTGSVNKGNPFAIDAVRWGRCEARIYGGDGTSGYATFTGFAAKNDANDATNGYNRWGLLQAIEGGFKAQGLVIFGYGAAVDFRDANTSIVIANTKKVTANFNAFEVRNATSRVDLTAISFTALGTVSRGNWITTDNADVNIDSCTFTDMGVFGFLAQATVLSSTFRRCGAVTQGGAALTGCLFTNSRAGTSAVIASNPSNISDCTFERGSGDNGIEITTPGEYTLSGVIFSGYTGTSTSAAIYNNSGGAVTLNITGGGTDPTDMVRNGAGASTNVVAGLSPITVTGLVTGSRVKIVRTDTQGVLFNGLESAGQVSMSTSYTGEILVEARKASGTPYYQPWYTLATVGTGVSVTALQVRDDQ